MFYSKDSFTLLELILVIAIISVLVAIIIPNFSNRHDSIQFELFCFRLLNFFKTAHLESVKKNSPVIVQIGNKSISVLLKDVEIYLLNIPDKYSVSAGFRSIEFLPSGELRIGSDSGYLSQAELLLSYEKHSRAIEFSAGSGNVNFKE